MEGSYFVRRGTLYQATQLTRGPWDPALQHAGPATALLAGAIERDQAASGLHLVRLTVDIQRPLPVGALYEVEVAPGRPGRKVRGLEATLRHDGRPAARASALLARTADIPVPPAVGPAESVAPVAACGPWQFPFFREDVGYHRSMELRRAAGVFGSGHMAVWFRLLCAVVEDEVPTPLQRLAAAADSGNGVSVALDLARYTFVNPDLTIALLRPPRGEWFALDARTLAAGEGSAIADAQLWDERGVLGRSVQTLLVEPRA